MMALFLNPKGNPGLYGKGILMDLEKRRTPRIPFIASAEVLAE
jgi:hypothetical protein